jgi:S1-C subfamily serine protease
VDGKPLTQDVDFYIHVLGLKADGRMTLNLRRGGRNITKVVSARAVPIPDGASLLREKFGLLVRLVSLDEAREYGIKGGLMVTGVDRGSQAAEVGFRRGMIVDQVGKYFPTDLDELGLVLEKVQRGEKVTFRLWTIGRDYMQAYSVALVSR